MINNFTKENFYKLIDAVKATDYKPLTLILTKKDQKLYKEYLKHLGNIQILIRKG